MSDGSNRRAKHYIKSCVKADLVIEDEILLLTFLDHWNNRQNIFIDKDCAKDLSARLNNFLAG